MTTTVEPIETSPDPAPARTAAAIADDITQRRDRRAELSARLEEVQKEIRERRAKRARALADGAGESDAGAGAQLAEEAEGLAQAMSLLDSDIADLERAAGDALLAEARHAERAAIEKADELAQELERLVVGLGSLQLIPAHDRLQAALTAARRAENETDRLVRLRDPNGPDRVRDRTGKVMARRGMLIEALGAVRRYVEKEPAP